MYSQNLLSEDSIIYIYMQLSFPNNHENIYVALITYSQHLNNHF